MSLIIKPNKQQALNVSMQLALLRMPANKRTRVLKTLGRYEKALARKRINTQTTVEGGPFKARANGKKGRMLKKLAKTLEPFVKAGHLLELKHKQASVGRVAALHQDGGREKMTATRMARIHSKTNYDAPCSRGAAKALVAEGYKVRKAKSKRYRKATINEVMESMNQGQASLILRIMRDKPNKKSWDIPVDGRPFLGDTTPNVQRQLVSIIEKINQKRG
jgi:hypothetical protein